MSDAAQAEETAPEVPTEAPTTTEPETLLDNVEPAPEPTAEPSGEDVVNTPTNPDARPEWLPEKFKSPEDLVTAYNEMGTKIREKFEAPEEYELKLPEGIDAGLTEADVQTFKEANLTNEQAQKVVDHMFNTIMPELMEAKVSVERERLSSEWGIKSDSAEFGQQLAKVKAWANQNLPDAVVTELSRTASGVATIAQMMEQKSQAHRATPAPASRPSKADLQNLMNDERYWKGDEEYRKYVTEQFKQAFD